MFMQLFRRYLHLVGVANLLFGLSTYAIAADRYTIDPLHTYTLFEYSHWGLSLQKGRFDKSSGFIEFDSDTKTGSIYLEVDASSVSTGSELFNDALRSDRFFDAKQFPKIAFRSSSLQFDETAKLVAVEGELTIKGVSKLVRLELSQFRCRFMPLYLKTACGANGSTKILRSDFDMGRFTPFVSDEVGLYFSIEAIKD